MNQYRIEASFVDADGQAQRYVYEPSHGHTYADAKARIEKYLEEQGFTNIEVGPSRKHNQADIDYCLRRAGQCSEPKDRLIWQLQAKFFAGEGPPALEVM